MKYKESIIEAVNEINNEQYLEMIYGFTKAMLDINKKEVKANE